MFRTLCFTASLVATSALAQAPRAPSTADLKFGTDIAAKFLPPGSYQRLMGGMMPRMMNGMSAQMSAMPLAPFLKAAGMPLSEAAKFGQTTIKQIMDIVDPAYQQRMDKFMPVMMAEMTKTMSQFEPEMRDGLAHAYANHFNSVELRDIDRFVNSPSGSAFAAQNLDLVSDPAVVLKTQAYMAIIAKSMPAIMEKASAASAGLPKPRTFQELSDAERAKLAQLLGVPAAKFKEGQAK